MRVRSTARSTAERPPRPVHRGGASRQAPARVDLRCTLAKVACPNRQRTPPGSSWVGHLGLEPRTGGLKGRDQPSLGSLETPRLHKTRRSPSHASLAFAGFAGSHAATYAAVGAGRTTRRWLQWIARARPRPRSPPVRPYGPRRPQREVRFAHRARAFVSRAGSSERAGAVPVSSSMGSPALAAPSGGRRRGGAAAPRRRTRTRRGS